MPSRYIVSRPDAGPTAQLVALLREFPAIDVIKVLENRAVVAMMDARTAQELRAQYPQLSIEEDVRHHRYGARA